jgi:hypothetical protein
VAGDVVEDRLAQLLRPTRGLADVGAAMQVVHVPAILVVLCLRRFEVDHPIHARRLSVIARPVAVAVDAQRVAPALAYCAGAPWHGLSV